MADVKLTAKISADSKELKQAMDTAKQNVSNATSNMKRDINSVSGALGDVSKEARGAGSEIAKIGSVSKDTQQAVKGIGQGLLGMGSQAAIIVKGLKAMGAIISTYVIDPIVTATKRLAEFKQLVAQGAGQTGEDRRRQMEEQKKELQSFVDLLEKYRQEKSETAKTALLQQQRKLSRDYGIDITPENANEVLKEQMDYQRNMKIATLRSEQKTLDEANTALLGQQRELEKSPTEILADQAKKGGKSYLNGMLRPTEIGMNLLKGNFGEVAKQGGFGIAGALIANGLEGGGKMYDASVLNAEKRQAEIDEVQKQISANRTKRQSLEQEIRKLQKTDDFADLQELLGAKRKDQKSQGASQFSSWENAINDTALQSQLRQVMEKYKQALENGIEPERAFAVAQREVQKILGGKYTEYLKILTSRIENVKNAYEAELKAQKRIEDARNRLADVLDENARERKQEKRNRQRQSIDRKIDALESKGHLSHKDEKRLERLKRQRDRLDERDERDERRDRRKRRRQREDEARDALEQARSEATAPTMRYMRAQAALDRMRNPEGVAGKLAEQMGYVTKDYAGIRTPGVGPAPTSLLNDRSQQLAQLHSDLQEIKEKYFFVK